ncbi:MAG: replication protein C, IncQ-type, partial [Pseudomonas aeruginosa]
SRLESARVVVEHDGYEIAYTTPWRLGAEDWQVFLVLCGLAGLDGKLFNSESKGVQLQLWDKFLSEGLASKGDSMRIRTTSYAVLRELGKHSGGKDYKELAASLERLASVTQTLRKGNKSASGSRLISYAFDEDSGELAVGLSHHMAKAILGESAQHVRISLVEMRSLENQASVLLQAIFSARIRPGSSAKYHLDTLAGHIYGKAKGEKVSAATLRKRRQRIKEALFGMSEWTTWQISIDANNIATVHRISKAQLEEWEKARELELLAEFPNDEAEELDEL